MLSWLGFTQPGGEPRGAQFDPKSKGDRRRIGGDAADDRLRHYVAAAFVDDGTHLVTLADNGHGNLWDIEPQSWARGACQIAGRTLTRTEWNAALSERTYAPACAAH